MRRHPHIRFPSARNAFSINWGDSASYTVALTYPSVQDAPGGAICTMCLNRTMLRHGASGPWSCGVCGLFVPDSRRLVIETPEVVV